MMWFVVTFPSTTIRIDETILVQIRSDAIDAIIQCYHQVMGGGSRSLSSSSSSSSLMDPPVAIGGVGTPAVRNSSPMSSMTMTFCSSTNTADYCDTHATAISTTATATPSNKKNSIASASPSTFLLVTGPTGSGKTKLTQYVLQEETRQQGGYFIRGTFDVLQHPDSYRTYSAAFTDFY
jgi:Cdc6-like AAA superfamily ATPase